MMTPATSTLYGDLYSERDYRKLIMAHHETNLKRLAGEEFSRSIPTEVQKRVTKFLTAIQDWHPCNDLTITSHHAAKYMADAEMKDWDMTSRNNEKPHLLDHHIQGLLKTIEDGLFSEAQLVFAVAERRRRADSRYEQTLLETASIAMASLARVMAEESALRGQLGRLAGPPTEVPHYLDPEGDFTECDLNLRLPARPRPPPSAPESFLSSLKGLLGRSRSGTTAMDPGDATRAVWELQSKPASTL